MASGIDHAYDRELNRFILHSTYLTEDVKFSAVLALDDMPIIKALDASHG